MFFEGAFFGLGADAAPGSAEPAAQLGPAQRGRRAATSPRPGSSRNRDPWRRGTWDGARRHPPRSPEGTSPSGCSFQAAGAAGDATDQAVGGLIAAGGPTFADSVPGTTGVDREVHVEVMAVLQQHPAPPREVLRPTATPAMVRPRPERAGRSTGDGATRCRARRTGAPARGPDRPPPAPSATRPSPSTPGPTVGAVEPAPVGVRPHPAGVGRHQHGVEAQAGTSGRHGPPGRTRAHHRDIGVELAHHARSSAPPRLRPAHRPVRQLSGINVSFLNMETPTVFGHVSSLNIYDPTTAPGGAGLDVTKQIILERMDQLVPFRRRLVEVPLGLDLPYWVEDDTFDIDFHVRHHAVAPPGTPEQLADAVSRIVVPPTRSQPAAVGALRDRGARRRRHRAAHEGAPRHHRRRVRRAHAGRLLDPDPRCGPPACRPPGSRRRSRPTAELLQITMGEYLRRAREAPAPEPAG